MNTPASHWNQFNCTCPIQGLKNCMSCPIFRNVGEVNAYIKSRSSHLTIRDSDMVTRGAPLGFIGLDLPQSLAQKVCFPGAFPGSFVGADISSTGIHIRLKDNPEPTIKAGTGKAEEPRKDEKKGEHKKPASKLYTVLHNGTKILEVYAYTCVSGPDKYWFISDKGKIIQKVSLECTIQVR